MPNDETLLKILKWLDWASAAVLGLSALITVASLGLTAWALNQAGTGTLVFLPILGFTGLVVVLLGAATWFAVVAARGVERGQGRVAQTILALFSLTSFPFGTAFGMFALWLCWGNETTKVRFEGGLKKDLPWLVAGLGLVLLPLVPLTVLTVGALLPTDLARLDAEWTPIEDRSQRVAHPGCGLTEVAPSCDRAAPTGVRTEEVRFPTRSDAMGLTELKGTLHLPEGLPGPRPAVVLIHGSGPADRDESAPGEVVGTYTGELKLFETLADHLAKQGLVVLRYDKRACPSCYPEIHADGDYSDFRFQLFLEDALAAGDYLVSRPEVDGRLVVIGHSQGGGFAPHYAAAEERTAAVVMLAGFTGTFREALLDQLERIGGIRGRQWDLLGEWSVKVQTEVIRSCLDKLDGPHDPADACLGGGVSLEALEAYDQLNATTPAVIGDLHVPLCAIAGTVDRNVPPQELVAIREATAGGDAEFHLISGVGHGLRNLVEPTGPEIDARVLERLDSFLRSVKGPVAPPEP